MAPFAVGIPDPEISVPTLMSARAPPVICVAGVMRMMCGVTSSVGTGGLVSMMTRLSQMEVTKPENGCDSESVAAGGDASSDAGAAIGEGVAIACGWFGCGARKERANGCAAKITPPVTAISSAAIVYAMMRVGVVMD